MQPIHLFFGVPVLILSLPFRSTTYLTKSPLPMPIPHWPWLLYFLSDYNCCTMIVELAFRYSVHLWHNTSLSTVKSDFLSLLSSHERFSRFNARDVSYEGACGCIWISRQLMAAYSSRRSLRTLLSWLSFWPCLIGWVVLYSRQCQFLICCSQYDKCSGTLCCAS